MRTIEEAMEEVRSVYDGTTNLKIMPEEYEEEFKRHQELFIRSCAEVMILENLTYHELNEKYS
jgi:hypothetical protein